MRRCLPILAIIALCASLAAQGTEPAAPPDDGAAAGEAVPEEALPAEGASPSGELEKQDYRPTDLIARFTVQVVLNRDQSVPIVSGPSPVVVVPGVAVAFPLGGRLSFVPGLEFYSAYYDWANDRAVPIGVEGRSATVAALILELPLAYDFRLPRAKGVSALGSGASSAQQKISVQGGLALLARAAFMAEGLLPFEQEDAQAKLGPITDYFWGKGRYLYPSLGLGYSYELADWVSFGVSARVMIPIFNLWTEEGLPFEDALHAGGGIWVSFTDFWRKQGKQQPGVLP